MSATDTLERAEVLPSERPSGLTDKERFWSRVKIVGLMDDPDQCWLWSGAKDGAGYGFCRAGGKQYRAHRYAMMLAQDGAPIPNGHVVCHKCDNPSCVRPGHLFIATQIENIADRDRKGRQASLRGESNPRAKLTYKIAEQIRKEYAAGGIGQAALGKKYGVAKCSIQNIIKGTSYPTPETLLRINIKRLIKQMGPEKATWWMSCVFEDERERAKR